jgi:hypothetical protein
MISLLLTEKERDVALFALRSDHETIVNNLDDHGDDERAVASAIGKLERTRGQESDERTAEPCPVCEMYVNIGLGSKDDKVMVTTDPKGNFAGAVAVHGKCEQEFKKRGL